MILAVSDGPLLTSVIKEVGEIGVGLSSRASTKTSWSSSSMMPMCSRMEVECPSSVESTSPIMGSLRVGIGEMSSLSPSIISAIML